MKLASAVLVSMQNYKLGTRAEFSLLCTMTRFKCFLNTIGSLVTFLFLLAVVLLPLASSETVAVSDKTVVKDEDEEWNTSDGKNSMERRL